MKANLLTPDSREMSLSNKTSTLSSANIQKYIKKIKLQNFYIFKIELVEDTE